MSQIRTTAGFVLRVLCGLACVAGNGCASYEPAGRGPVSQARDRGPVVVEPPSEFETPPVLSAREILPAELYEGPHHRVEDAVLTYGYANTYTVVSDYDTYAVVGDDMLRARVQEIAALAALEEISRSRAFADGVVQAAKSPFRAAKDLILHPVDTISGIPKGMWRIINRVGGMVAVRRGEFEESVIRELIAFSWVKRQYAHMLGVDVYSTNSVLQKELNRVSWAAHAGAVGVAIPVWYIPGAAGITVQATMATARLNTILRDFSPEDLRRLNRKKLVDAGFETGLVDNFLSHRWFSPRHKTYIADALEGLADVEGKDTFLSVALSASSEEDALFFQRMADMMRGYHDHISPVRRIVVVWGLPAAYTAEESLALFLQLDYGSWTQAAAEASQAIAEFQLSDAPIARRELWLTGRLSDHAREKTASLGIVVHENSYDELQPPPNDQVDESHPDETAVETSCTGRCGSCGPPVVELTAVRLLASIARIFRR
ncbi:MAG: hypothetical protein JSV78_09565 [Phycisphaerales bacterium]|nr:MAG: hypothetical protein JSV78_09565 [Phycisphaerales bacterium]